MQLVNGFGGGVQGGIEAEGDLGGGEVVINRLGYADHVQALALQIERDLLRAIATDHNKSVNPQLPGICDHLIGDVVRDFLAVFRGDVAEWIAAIGGAENRSAAREDSADVGQFQRARLVGPDEALEAILNADHLPVVF